MSTRPLSPETRALLERERAIQPLPAAQRARAIARAQAALAAGNAATRVPAGDHRRRGRWALAAAAALLCSAAVGAAAYEIHARLARAPQIVPVAKAPAVAVAPAARPAAVAADEQPVAADEQPVAPEPVAAAPALSRAEAARAELRLLRAARTAVARGDFAAALVPIGEHAHRFKNGRLAEEREALRVKSLAGLGRTEEARRAAAAFRARFPRSVLLPAVSRMPASTP
jgi:hypothetical protein